jgi:hypothetical protein
VAGDLLARDAEVLNLSLLASLYCSTQCPTLGTRGKLGTFLPILEDMISCSRGV